MKKLKPRLPAELVGKDRKKGFLGDRAQSPRFAADEWVVILRSAILDDWDVAADEHSPLILAASIQRLWEATTRAPSRVAHFVGCVMWAKTPVAIISDGKAFTAIDPYKLSYAVQATAADGLEVNMHRPHDQPLVLMKDGNPVAMIAALRVANWEELIRACDLVHEPVSLQSALAPEEKKSDSTEATAVAE